MKLHRKGLLTATVAAAAGLTLTGALIAASAASAAAAGHSATTGRGSSVVYNTVSAGHWDTTSDGGTATFSSPNGPVWAIDTLKEHWVVTACSANPACTPSDGANYAVTLTVGKGSKFAEFADPGPSTGSTTDPCPPAPGGGSNAGGPHTGSGNVLGNIEFDISSSTAPNLAGVPAVEPPNTSLGAVLDQIFGGSQQQVGGGHYNFTYTSVCGAVYTQTG